MGGACVAAGGGGRAWLPGGACVAECVAAGGGVRGSGSTNWNKLKFETRFKLNAFWKM